MDPNILYETYIPVWEELVRRHCRRSAGGSPSADQLLREQQEHVEALWHVFNTDREAVRYYLKHPKKSIAAYLAGFHLPAVARALGILARLSAPSSGLTVIDAGCGTGALSHALHHVLRSQGGRLASVALIDQLPLDVAKEGHLLLDPETRVHTIKGDLPTILSSWRHDPVDWLLLGHTLNEIPPAKLRRFLDTVSRGPARNLLITEPAREEESRLAMAVRDALVESGWIPLYPCPHTKPCPMNDEGSKDWCFSEFDVKAGRAETRLNRSLGLRGGRRTATAFALTRAGSAPSPSVGTVVGFPIMPSGTRKALVCRPDGKLKKDVGGQSLRGTPFKP